ncbi:hypothetical protein C3L33_15948, partial [Rhododendron williamsianum]
MGGENATTTFVVATTIELMHIFTLLVDAMYRVISICGLYERKLKELNPAIRNITYDIADLYNFMDGLADLSALVYDHSIQAYLPYDRQWIKQRTFRHLEKLAH